MEVRAKMTARGKIAFVLLDDGTTPREVSVFSEVFDNNRQRIVVDEVLIVEVKVSNDDFSGGLRIVADKLMTLGEARGRFARALQLRLNGEVGETGGPVAAVDRLQAALEPFREGDCQLRVRYRNAQAEGDLPSAPTVRPDDSLLDSLREWLPPGAVEVIIRRVGWVVGNGEDGGFGAGALAADLAQPRSDLTHPPQTRTLRLGPDSASSGPLSRSDLTQSSLGPDPSSLRPGPSSLVTWLHPRSDLPVLAQTRPILGSDLTQPHSDLTQPRSNPAHPHSDPTHPTTLPPPQPSPRRRREPAPPNSPSPLPPTPCPVLSRRLPSRRTQRPCPLCAPPWAHHNLHDSPGRIGCWWRWSRAPMCAPTVTSARTRPRPSSCCAGGSGVLVFDDEGRLQAAAR